MSLQLAAQHLASKGRGPDTTLVHMAPQEVAGLQALARAHGGTLTTNPDTGLPEAGFLSAILPMIAGAALGPAGVGLFGSALTAGLGVGAATGLATGSLKRGLMAGLGAYGGAGLGSAVSGAGTAQLSAAAGQPLPPVVDVGPIATQAPIAQAASFPGTLTGADFAGQAAGLSADAAANASRAMFPGTLTGAEFAPQAASLSSDALTNARMASFTPMDRFGAGIEAISKDPSKLFNAGNLKYAAAAAAPLMFQEPKKQPAYTGSGPNPYQYAYDPGRQAYAPTSSSSEQMYFDPRYTRLAEGGVATLAGGGSMGRLVEALKARSGAGARANPFSYTYDPETQSYTQLSEVPVEMDMAAGGISHLGDYSDGGRLLRGPGDGVSDDIPATIADKRPARLADGEFVVPARIVSELGNGSTEAGARKLYAMMDRVQKARNKTVGKNKVAVDTRTEKLLPA